MDQGGEGGGKGGRSLHTATHIGSGVLGCGVAPGAHRSCVCAIRAQRRGPSVLQGIVDGVPGDCGAGHSSSSPASAPCPRGGVVESANGACLVPQMEGWSCGERDSAPEHQLGSGAPPLTETLGGRGTVLHIQEGGVAQLWAGSCKTN